MDNRRRGHNDAPYQGQDPRFSVDQSQARGFAASAPDRYRPSAITTSPNRGVGGATAYSGYYQEPSSVLPGNMSQSSMQYQSNYPPDQRHQQQSYGSYGSDMMYGVAQQAPQSNVYETSPQFQARQPAAMQIISDVATPYFQSDTSNAPAPSLQHHASSSSSNVYQQGSPNGRIMQQGYSTNMAVGGMPQTAPEMLPEEDFVPEASGMEAAYTSYQTALKEVFQNILNGRLNEASQSLLNVSEWLLGHVQDLGLIVDEVGLHSDRIRLWGEFNNAWLGIFQKQKDMLEIGQQVLAPQSLMSQDFINKMMKDLIRLCDGIELHGLVDYQYGVAEERIVMIAEEVLDLQESIEGSSS